MTDYQTQRIAAVLCISLIAATGCKQNEKKPAGETQAEQAAKLELESRKITDSAQYWWAHVPADVTGDGLADLVHIHNNASGGYLGYYQGQEEPGNWTLVKIAETPPDGGLFAGGDLATADLDNDGDQDIIGIRHPGEWTDASAEATLYWYENPQWQVHPIGKVPDAVKDVSFEDFDGDGKKDLAVLTFDEHTLSIFHQGEDASQAWERVQFITDERLHEGMDTGDLDGDGHPDIVANGFAFYNPGSDIREAWEMEQIDSIWNNQEGDWSRNGTKTFLKDLDGDGRKEVFIGHSERAGYPLNLYRKQAGGWQAERVADSIPACHTLQVYDFDGDGEPDVLAGVNAGRAVNLGYDSYPITLFRKNPQTGEWDPEVLREDGIYNGQAIDFEGDGDMDIFRYPNHEATDYYLMLNQSNPENP